jgi:hypothetical protein
LVEQQVQLVLLAHQVQPLDQQVQRVPLELETQGLQVRLEVLEALDRLVRQDQVVLVILVQLVRLEVLDRLVRRVQLAHKVFQ